MTDISVPHGGGALAGIGETFQPDLHTGTAHLRIPLPLPPGRGGLTPSLELSYSSGSGNGPFGQGWSLGVPRIARRTDRRVPLYDDTVDVFVLSGAEELAPVPLVDATPPDLPAGAAATRYRPRSESVFARIVHVVGPLDDYWDVWDGNGLQNRYGTRPPDDAGEDWEDSATIRTPAGEVFSWLLTATRDSFGNRIAYTYRGDGGAQRYLSTVSYADHGDPAAPEFAVTVTVVYGGGSRPDPFSERRPGFDLRTALRAARIEVTTPGTVGMPSTVVELGYADEQPGAVDAGGPSLLTSIQVVGQEGETQGRQRLSPSTFTYSTWNPEGRRYRTLPASLPRTALGAGTELVDLSGDGLPSVVQLDGTARYWRNVGGSAFALPRSLASAPAGAAIGTPGVLLADLDADGRPEVSIAADGRTTIWMLAPGTIDPDRPGFVPVARRPGAAPPTGYAGPQTRVVDLDGDHVPDLLMGGSAAARVASADGAGGFGPLAPLRDAPPILTDLSNPHLHLVDMTGDGLTDVVEVHDGSVRYWPGLGRRRFGPPVRMSDAPRIGDVAGSGLDGFDPARLLLGDVTGDGTADLVYVGDGTVTIWLNRAGNGFGPPTVLHGTPRVAGARVRLADLEGIGVAGILWSGVGTHGDWAFLDLTGGTKPYLLTEADNHRGARTEVVWSTSTAFALADRAAGRAWRTTLPFPVHVVAATRTTDWFSGTVLSSAFTYYDGYWDPADREFRGFGCVEHIDTVAPARRASRPPSLLRDLDPLTPALPLPDAFDASAHGNLLANWSFDEPGSAGRTTLTTTADNPFAPGPSAAASWTTWNNVPATTTTELVPSDLPQGRGGRMLHVETDGGGCGIVQTFLPEGTGPAHVVAAVWVKVLRGAVVVGTGNGGDIAVDATCDRTGRWVLVEAGNQRAPANEVIVYAAGAGGAEFVVDHAWIRVEVIPADPVDTPPVRTVTWFHLGPVGPVEGDWGAYTPRGYWEVDPPLSAQVDLGALPDDLPRPMLREALRALRGRVLRTELYGDDGDPDRADRPYEVHDNGFEVAPVLDGRDVSDPSWRAAPVVNVREVLARSTAWDRGHDPMTRLTVHGRHDQYGRPHAGADIGVPRGRDPRRPGEPCLATVRALEYATRDDATLYRTDRVCRRVRHEAEDAGTGSVVEFAAAALAGERNGAVRALELSYYDGEPFTGLELGRLGAHALPVRREELVLTPERLAAIGEPLVQDGTTAPPLPWLDPSGAPPSAASWGADHPQAFRDWTSQAPGERGPRLGYVWHDADASRVAGYYRLESRLAYDVQTPVPGRPPRGLVLVSRDAVGGDTTTVYDERDLLPVAVTDPAGLRTEAEYDDRVLKPRLVTDANGHRTAVTYTPLGLPAAIAVLGRAEADDGDTLEQPGQLFSYDLTAWDDALAARSAPQPASVTTVRRVEHRWMLVHDEDERRRAAGLPPLTEAEITAMFPATELTDHPDRFVRVVEFSDGLGRLLQTRTQADLVAVSDLGLPDDLGPAARAVAVDPSPAKAPVVVTGWKRYDAKGRPVVAYEPFRDSGWRYAAPDDDGLRGLAAVRQHRDPRGRLVAVVAPDGSRTRTLYGVPLDSSRPEEIEPTPWETWTYDADDEGGRTHPTACLDVAAQWDTPASSVVDSFGRGVLTVRRGLEVDVVTRNEYDIDGNLVAVTDALGRLASRTLHDTLGRAWSQWLIDSGTTRAAFDPLGMVTERRDDKGAVVLTAFDRAHRVDRLWASDRRGQRPTLRHVTVFGDDVEGSGLSQQDAAAANVRGRPVVVLDEAGRVTTGGYDLGARPVSTVRRVLRPDVLLGTLPPAGGDWSATGYAVDWSPGAGTTLAAHAEALLDPAEYQTDVRFDAVGRPTRTTGPLDATGVRSVISFAYTRGGGLTRVVLDGVEHLSHVVHDAQGRRVLALLGNGVLMRHRYDPRTQRLRRTRAEHAAATGGGWTCDGPVLQDVSHRYDPAGNLVTLGDRTPGCGVPPGDPDALDRHFGYDPLGRLLAADGRETDVAPADPWIDVPRTSDVTRARRYAETYSYDLVGNLLTLRHGVDGAAGGYTRTYDTGAGNRLGRLTVGTTSIPYSYDARGNTTSEASNRFFEWDHADRLLVVRDQAGRQQPSVYAQYRYDAAGQRVLKVVRRMSGPDLVTVYVGGFERVLRGTVAAPTSTHDEIRLTDQGAALAAIRRGDPLPDDPMAAHPVTYQLGDHLGSVTSTLAEDGAVLDREEYLPYGETSFGSYTRKRYRFTAKVRDEESGFAYHGARYYAPWLARWLTTDPLVHRTGKAYAYTSSPLTETDPRGLAPTPPTSGTKFDVMDPKAGVDMNDAPAGSPRTAHRPGEKEGYPRNAPWFWRTLLEEHPEWFSTENEKWITNERSPEVDEQWLKYHEHDLFVGDLLHHHHVDRGPLAVPLPRRFHEIFHHVLHEYRVMTPNTDTGILTFPAQEQDLRPEVILRPPELPNVLVFPADPQASKPTILVTPVVPPPLPPILTFPAAEQPRGGTVVASAPGSATGSTAAGTAKNVVVAGAGALGTAAVGYGVWLAAKWIVAAVLAPETGGVSLAVAAASP